MKPGFRLRCIEVGRRGTLYTAQFDDQQETEYDRFASDPECQAHEDNFDSIQARLDDMLGRYGFEDRFFKWEGAARDSVCALYYDKGPLRLYCCRWSRILLIAGYGGVKTTRTYQEDPRLHEAVRRMQHVDRQLYHRIVDDVDDRLRIMVDDHEQRFLGNLVFKPEDLI